MIQSKTVLAQDRVLLMAVKVGEVIPYPSLIPGLEGPTELRCTGTVSGLGEDAASTFTVEWWGIRLGTLTVTRKGDLVEMDLEVEK